MNLDMRIFLSVLLANGPAVAAPDSVLLLESAGGSCAATLLDGQGHVATAYHCVNSRRSIHLRSAPGQRVKAERLATRRDLDLAILRAEGLAGAEGMPIRVDDLVPGERVLVYGHPFYSASKEIPALEGLLAFSRASGTVSAVGPYLTQLDVAFNPGVSGGPVVDEQGRLAGVASRKLEGEHLSFASPAAPLVEMLANPHVHGLSGKLAVLAEVDLPLDAGAVPSLHLSPQLLLWDWIGLEGSLGWELGGNWVALSQSSAHWTAWRGAAFLRFRVGSGGQSAVVEMGGRVSGTMELSAHWKEEGFQFKRQEGPLGMGPAIRLNWKAWSLGGEILKRDDQWVPAMALGFVLNPRLLLF